MRLFGITATDFRRLAALVAICSLALLLPLPLLFWVPKKVRCGAAVRCTRYGAGGGGSTAAGTQHG